VAGSAVITGGFVITLLLLKNAEEGEGKEVIGMPPEPPSEP